MARLEKRNALIVREEVLVRRGGEYSVKYVLCREYWKKERKRDTEQRKRDERSEVKKKWKLKR